MALLRVLLLRTILHIGPYFAVNGYVQTIPNLVQVQSGMSPTADNAKAYAPCPTSSPTIVSCELISGSDKIDGTYVDNNKCVAQNGYGNPNGVKAIAACIDSDYTCSYPVGDLSSTADDATSSTSCSGGQIMVACSAESPWKSIDGSYIGTHETDTIIDSDTLCTARNDGGFSGSSGVYAHGICCEYTGGNGYSLDCKTQWGSAVSDGVSTSQCDSGYTILSCSGYGRYKDSLAAYYRHVQNNQCRIQSVLNGIQAVATCCRLYKAPTSLPTTSPTPSPTPSPTQHPTPVPTAVPTLSPTRNPTASPTCHVYGVCASVSIHCADTLTVDYAANGIDFNQMQNNTDWMIETRVFFEEINVNSVFRFECQDTIGSGGGFIASVYYKDVMYSTTNPIDIDGFTVIASSDGNITPLIYTTKASAPWNINTNNIADNAYWIWNEATNNKMTFEWRFDHILSKHPTVAPTPYPSVDPTKSPSTPSPSKPGTLVCGDREIGDYNNEALNFTVRMPFFGDLTFNASLSAFTITSISAMFDAAIIDNDADYDGVLTLYDLKQTGDYIFTIHGVDGVHDTFTIDIICESDHPTVSPTNHPTIDPTTDPTKPPSRDPTPNPSKAPTTDAPTLEPTLQPTYDPTVEPTLAPTVSPTTTPTRSPQETLIVYLPTRPPTKRPTTSIATTELHHDTTVDTNQGNKNSKTVTDLYMYELYIGISIGAIAGICIGCILYYVLVRKKREKQNAEGACSASPSVDAILDIAVVQPNAQTTRGADDGRGLLKEHIQLVGVLSKIPGLNVNKSASSRYSSVDQDNTSSDEGERPGNDHDDLYDVPVAQVTVMPDGHSDIEGPQVVLPGTSIALDATTTPGDLNVDESDSDSNDSDSDSNSNDADSDKLYGKGSRKATSGSH